MLFINVSRCSVSRPVKAGAGLQAAVTAGISQMFLTG
jgi:hypothetical protein